MTTCASKRHSIPYEPIWDENDLLHHQHRRQQTWRRILTFAALAVTVVVILLQVRQSENHHHHGVGFEQPKHAGSKQHLLPTLLYVVDPLTGNYMNAIVNPLYEKLKASNFVNTTSLPDNAVIEMPRVSVDRSSYQLREPLTLSWTMGQESSGAMVKDNDMIVLYCGSHDEADSRFRKQPHQFLEAATVAHARATSQKHGTPYNDDNKWYIPSFPVTQHPACQFTLYQQATFEPPTFAILAESPIFVLHGPETPTAVHLALTTNPSEMTVQFNTFVQGTPVVWYWPATVNADAKKMAMGDSHTYTADALCQAPANMTEAGKFQSPGWLHQVTLTDLEPDTRYYYQVGLLTPQQKINSRSLAGPFSFQSSQQRGDNKPFAFLVYGDQGVVSDTFGDQGQWTAAMVARELDYYNATNSGNVRYPARAIHHFGDLSYAMGAAHVWDDWFYQISSFSPRVPLMISVGNHEYDHTDGGGNGKDPSNVTESHGYMPAWGNFANDSGGECGVPTAARFTMPKSKGSNGVFWYSFDMASVHTIVLSSEHDLTKGSPQHTWFESDLQSVNRTLTPWLLVELHRPLYEAEPSIANNLVGVEMRHAIEDLLMQYKVDLVLAGHYHAYHRTCDGLYRGKCHVVDGPMHITVGSAGATLDPIYPLFLVRWTETFIGQEFGYGRITVHNATVMRFDFVKAGPQHDPTAGEIHDTAWIVRRR